MKSTYTLWVLLFCMAVPGAAVQAQVFQLTVNNGYTETTQAAPGDTIHIWAQEWGANRIFSHWTGDTSFLEMPQEWHTRIIMPAQHVTLSAELPVLPTGVNNPFTEEQIMGRDRLKRVFSYFPANTAPKGVCWLWHGTNGSASTWAGSEYEQFQFARYLVLKGWGVIITESDESTVGMDLNGDAAIRYDYFPDSVQSVDIANVRAIRDTFIQRGKMSWSTPQAALGFSAGGAFSTLLAGILNWQAAVTHCNPGVTLAVQNATVPMLFSMNQRDSHPDVGVAGAMQAYENWEYLTNKGICADFDLFRPSPIYPERFKRLPGITSNTSYAINNELVSNGCLGNGGYLIKSPAQIETEVFNNPSNWPVIVGLTNPQRQFVKDQLDVMWSAHHFHSDFMAADFAFISNPCGTLVPTLEPKTRQELTVFPNPAGSWIQLPESVTEARVFDLNGVLVLEQKEMTQTTMSISGLPSGIYFLQSGNARGKFVKQ